jgi:regulator of replication initiation timing
LFRNSEFFQMANEQILISGIEYKVRKLIEKFVSLKKENEEFRQHINALEEKEKALTIELEEKRNELFKISLANALENKYGVEESKTKIDELIKEIDQCIEVMSD